MTTNRIKSALVVGSGGLGSEIIKVLRNYSIVIKALDFDRIETSNLNRQFFFTSKDGNSFKSQTIAKKIRCEYAVMKIEDVDEVFLDDFDVIFSCLDSVSSRMELNYRFMNSRCPQLVDCGVENMRCHVKRVMHQDPCLYCIKDLYNTDVEPFLCSLKSLDDEVCEQNREKYLSSVVFRIRERYSSSGQPREDEDGTQCSGQDRIYLEIVDMFNQRAPEHLRTNIFEVEGVYKSIVPNICTINSICASYAVLMVFEHRDYDFVYYDGTELPFTRRIKLDRDPSCFVCKDARRSS